MADFTPRFVDLVKSYTTTVGTGDFTLGAAVNGFTGFTSALAAADGQPVGRLGSLVARLFYDMILS